MCYLPEGEVMSNFDAGKVSRLFMFRFKGVMFDTDDGMGSDESLTHVLNEKYGNMKIDVRADDENDALREAIRQLTDAAGYEIIDADYDIHVS